MLDKSAYYHGAAIVAVLEDSRCRSIGKKGSLGYVVNSNIFLFIKYTTKSKSPWRFTFDQEDIDRCIKMGGEYDRIVLGLVCGGDGVCGVAWEEARSMLGMKAGWLAAARKHNQSYEVWGPENKMTRKVSLRRWPTLIFEPGDKADTSPAHIEQLRT